MIRIATAFVFVLAAVPCALAEDVAAPNVGAWDLPVWAPNDAVMQGTFSTKDGDVQIRLRVNDGEPMAMENVTFEKSTGHLAFTFPELDYDTYGFVHVWAEDAAGNRIGDKQTVAVADWREFDISGQTAVELFYPMKSWDMQVRFTPCCLINGGYLRVNRVPVNPAPGSDGLPAVLLSAFLHLAPDDVVVATSGLNADMGIDPGSPFAETPEQVTVYQWFKGRWTPVIGAEYHEASDTIRFTALEGGYFVLGPKPETAE